AADGGARADRAGTARGEAGRDPSGGLSPRRPPRRRRTAAPPGGGSSPPTAGDRDRWPAPAPHRRPATRKEWRSPDRPTARGGRGGWRRGGGGAASPRPPKGRKWMRSAGGLPRRRRGASASRNALGAA